jgi:hypothetical protein
MLNGALFDLIVVPVLVVVGIVGWPWFKRLYRLDDD